MNNIHGLSGARSGGRGGGGAGGGGGGSSTPGCMDQIKSNWASVPLFNKWICTTLTVIMLVGFFLPSSQCFYRTYSWISIVFPK